MASNTAAWLLENASPFSIQAAPLGKPGPDQILVKNHAVAMNPIDGKVQYIALFSPQYPTILGHDLAGEVAEVGPNVTRFKKGDRVLAAASGFHSRRHEEVAFQTYTVVHVDVTSEIPHDVSYESAAVLPLATATAAAALFQPDFFNLQVPSEPPQASTGMTLLVWGGASSVGSCAIQLAVAAGYEVVTTASPQNFSLVKKLGASQVFDYSSPTVIADLISAFKGRTSIGVFDAIGLGAWKLPLEFVQKSDGAKLVVTVTFGWADEVPEGITMKMVSAFTIIQNHVAKAVFEDFLPKALEAGSYILAPEPLVAGKGLEAIQGAVDLQMKGVSAKKIVVLL